MQVSDGVLEDEFWFLWRSYFFKEPFWGWHENVLIEMQSLCFLYQAMYITDNIYNFQVCKCYIINYTLMLYILSVIYLKVVEFKWSYHQKTRHSWFIFQIWLPIYFGGLPLSTSFIFVLFVLTIMYYCYIQKNKNNFKFRLDWPLERCHLLFPETLL